MEARFWNGKHAPCVANHIDFDRFNTWKKSLSMRSVPTEKALPASLGKTASFSEIDRLSTRFAAYLQNHIRLKPGDNIAIQLPNLLQYPVVVYGAIKAAMVDRQYQPSVHSQGNTPSV